MYESETLQFWEKLFAEINLLCEQNSCKSNCERRMRIMIQLAIRYNEINYDYSNTETGEVIEPKF